MDRTKNLFLWSYIFPNFFFADYILIFIIITTIIIMIITIVPNQIFPLQKIIRKRHLLHHSGFHQQETDPGLNLWMTLMQILVILQHLLLIRILKMIKVMPKLMIRIIQGMYSQGRENIVWYFGKIDYEERLQSIFYWILFLLVQFNTFITLTKVIHLQNSSKLNNIILHFLWKNLHRIPSVCKKNIKC